MAQIEDILTNLANSYPQVRTELNFSSPYELLVATILSAQTTDRQVNKVTPGLLSSTLRLKLRPILTRGANTGCGTAPYQGSLSSG